MRLTGRQVPLAAFIISALCFADLPASAQTAGSAAAPRATVQATGQASVSITPDQARIDAAAITQAATAQDAASQNASVAANVIAQVKQALGASGTVQTVSYSVNPTYNNTGVLTGYTVTNTIEIILNDLTMTGAIIDHATQAGATRISSLQFTLRDDSAAPFTSPSRRHAAGESEADAMAGGVGLKTGAIMVIQEAGAVVQPLATGLAAAPAATPIVPGQVSVQANVTIEVELTQ